MYRLPAAPPLLKHIDTYGSRQMVRRIAYTSSKMEAEIEEVTGRGVNRRTGINGEGARTSASHLTFHSV